MSAAGAAAGGASPHDDDIARLARLRLNLRLNAPQLLPGARRAAVACLLRLTLRGELEVLFITRAAHPGDPWSGDVAWPGGRLEAGETALAAAVRETREELGLELSAPAWTLLGPLPDRPAVRTAGLAKLVVRAFVFLHDERAAHGVPLPPFTPEPREVDAVWWVPLRTLTHAGALPFFEVPVARLQTRLPMLVRAPAQHACRETALRCACAALHCSSTRHQRARRALALVRACTRASVPRSAITDSAACPPTPSFRSAQRGCAPPPPRLAWTPPASPSSCCPRRGRWTRARTAPRACGASRWGCRSCWSRQRMATMRGCACRPGGCAPRRGTLGLACSLSSRQRSGSAREAAVVVHG
jgi:8-oxo-dGTP pyrophosphatase MutT (NUDIX family)